MRDRITRALTPLHGWTTPDKGVRLAELVIASSADLSVEIGVFGGRGTIAMAIGHQIRNHGRVVAIDPWDVAASLEGVNDAANDDWWGRLDHEAIYQHFLDALRHNGVEAFCCVRRERSDTAVAAFDDGSIDVLHQDGNHSEQISAAEVDLWAPKVKPGGYWIADDTDWATTSLAQTRLVDHGFEAIEDHASWRVYRKR